jgi:translation initiation factor 3 subunit B
MIQISHDRVDFLGGSEMQPIITLMEAGVNFVSMSPCEQYVLTYNQTSKKEAFIVWNFKLTDKIRSFEKEMFDKAESYKWSHDGKYIAKKFRTDKTNELGETKTKTGLSVFGLPSMDLLEKDGNKKSITIDGIEAFEWSPSAPILVYSAFPEGNNQYSRVGFLKIPQRHNLMEMMQKDAEEFKLVFHP